MTEEQPLRPLTEFQKTVIAIGLVAMGAGMSINFVVVSPLAREAGLSEVEVALILTVSAAVYAFMTPIWGRLAERFGRKRVMVFSLCASGGTNAIFALGLRAALAGLMTGLTTLSVLAFMRLFFGLLAPGLHPAAMAAMTDATTAHDRAAGLGLLGAAMGLGSIAGPAGAALLANISALAPLWGIIVLAFAVAVLLAFALPPTRADRAAGKAKPAPLKLTDKRIAPYLFFLLAYFIAVAAIQQSTAWLVEDRFGWSGKENVRATGLVFASLSFTLLIIQFGYIQPRKPDPRKVLPMGLALIAIGYLFTAFVPAYWEMVVAFGIVGLGAGLTVPSVNALGSLSVARQEQGAAAALLATAPPAGYVLGPLFGAVMYEVYPPLPFFVSGVAVAILGVIAVTMLIRRPLAAPAE